MSKLEELRTLMKGDLRDLYDFLQEEDDWEALVALWEDVQTFRQDLGEINSELEVKIYNRQDKERPYGSKVVTRYRASSKKWDNQEVWRRIRLFCTDKQTGEVDEAHVGEIARRAGYISYWRVGDLPFEVDEDTRSVVYGAKKIRVEPGGTECPTSPTPTVADTSSVPGPQTPTVGGSSTSSSSEKPSDTSGTTA